MRHRRPPTWPLLWASLMCAATAAATATDAPTELLKASETADPKKVDIVKQIRRLNDDGSYTVGYEAGDGTFKIESRDVRGNVKGTFGYVDGAGEIKRVTYSSSNSSTPTPVAVGAAAEGASTTRRPLATVVYPRAGSANAAATVIQPIPRKRLTADSKENTSGSTPAPASNIYNSKLDETIMKPIKMQMLKPPTDFPDREIQTKPISTEASARMHQYTKPVYEHVTEKEAPRPSTKANQIRRQLPGAAGPDNPHMLSLRQSAGGDASDVYGAGHRSLGTARPLFTTTSPRPRLVPAPPQYVASSPLQAAATHRDRADEELSRRPLYENVQFRTTEYLRDNPGAPVPIGNQRPYLEYRYRSQPPEPPQPPAAAPAPYALTRIIPIAVDERGVPIPGYRFTSDPFAPPLPPPPPPEPAADDMQSITTPVSTRDLRRLLHVLLLRQTRLQALMDEMSRPGAPYGARPHYDGDYLPSYRQRQYGPPARQQKAEAYDGYGGYGDYGGGYGGDVGAYSERQRELYTNDVSGYEEAPPYGSRQYVTRRRRPPAHAHRDDADAAPSGGGEYLPADVREALLLRMLMLAISPEYLPRRPTAAAAPPPPTELTTAAPLRRKQVRNVQVLGEEGSELTHGQ